MKILGIFLLLLVVVISDQPPTWPLRFQQDFVESYTNTRFYTAGKLWFDSERQMERLDRNNGKADPICGPLSN